MNQNLKDLFFDLCLHAEKHDWCCNLFCSTCGHTAFRYGLWELTKKKSPKHKNWLTNERWPAKAISHYKNEIDVINIKDHLQKSKSLHNIIKNCNIQNVLENISSPKNMAMLGIGLFYTEVFENEYKTISISWKSQFFDYFSKKPGGLDFGVDSLLYGEKCISWKDLELLKIFIS